MCPTFVATGDEVHSTRGRANTIRAALEGRFGPPREALASPELEAAHVETMAIAAAEDPSDGGLAEAGARLRATRPPAPSVRFEPRRADVDRWRAEAEQPLSSCPRIPTNPARAEQKAPITKQIAVPCWSASMKLKGSVLATSTRVRSTPGQSMK